MDQRTCSRCGGDHALEDCPWKVVKQSEIKKAINKSKVKDEPHQEIIDELSALVLKGRISVYAAKEVRECEAWAAGKELIRLAKTAQREKNLADWHLAFGGQI